MKPPSGGPITGPTSAGTVTQAIAFTSALLSMERSSTSRPTGLIIAPPMPCRMRAIKKSVTEPDKAQPIEPTMNTATARENTRRAPNRSAVQPLAGMNTASDKRYEVIASFSVSGLVPISAAIAGSDVAITVESMFSMNRAVATMRGIRRSFFMEIRNERRGGAGGAVSSHCHGGYCGTGRDIQIMRGSAACEPVRTRSRTSQYAIFFLTIVSHYAIFGGEGNRIYFRRRP